MVQVLFLVTQIINYSAVNCRTDPTQPKQCLYTRIRISQIKCWLGSCPRDFCTKQDPWIREREQDTAERPPQALRVSTESEDTHGTMLWLDSGLDQGHHSNAHRTLPSKARKLEKYPWGAHSAVLRFWHGPIVKVDSGAGFGSWSFLRNWEPSLV